MLSAELTCLVCLASWESAVMSSTITNASKKRTRTVTICVARWQSCFAAAGTRSIALQTESCACALRGPFLCFLTRALLQYPARAF